MNSNSCILQILLLEIFFLLSKAPGFIGVDLFFALNFLLLHLLPGVWILLETSRPHLPITLNLLPTCTSRCLQSNGLLRYTWWGLSHKDCLHSIFPKTVGVTNILVNQAWHIIMFFFLSFHIDKFQISNCRHVFFFLSYKCSIWNTQ